MMDDSMTLIIILLIAAAMILFLAAFNNSRKSSKKPSSLSGTPVKEAKKTPPEGHGGKETLDTEPKGDGDKGDSGTGGAVIIDGHLKKKDPRGGGGQVKASSGPEGETVVLFEPGFAETGWRCLFCEAENRLSDFRCCVCGRDKNEV